MRILSLALLLCLVIPKGFSLTTTGHRTISSDTIPEIVTEKMPVTPYTFKAKQLILPVSLIAVGALGTALDGWQDFHLISRKSEVNKIRVDDYMEWGMFGWVFVCDIFAKEKHHFVDQLFLLTLAEGFNAGMIHGVKNTVKETRPDGGPRSFPSGHTANAFLGAHLAYKEFKDSAPALAYSGYALAAFVGGLRIYNNRHWVADVLTGAGIGILSVELSYLVYFPIRNAIAKQVNAKAAKNLVLAPSITPQGGGIYLSFHF